MIVVVMAVMVVMAVVVGGRLLANQAMRINTNDNSQEKGQTHSTQLKTTKMFRQSRTTIAAQPR